MIRRSAAAAPAVAATTLPAAVAILGGLGLIAGRPWVAHSVAGLGLLYASLLGVSLGARLDDDRPAPAVMRPEIVLAAGIGAAVLVRVAQSPIVPPDRRLLAVVFGLAAAVAEEAYFRRLVHSTLARLGAAFAVVGGAALFALVHYPGYGAAAMPLDFGAGLLFGWQRWASGSWTIPAATHAAANLLSSI